MNEEALFMDWAEKCGLPQYMSSKRVEKQSNTADYVHSTITYNHTEFKIALSLTNKNLANCVNALYKNVKNKDNYAIILFSDSTQLTIPDEIDVNKVTLVGKAALRFDVRLHDIYKHDIILLTKQQVCNELLQVVEDPSSINMPTESTKDRGSVWNLFKHGDFVKIKSNVLFKPDEYKLIIREPPTV